MGDAIQTIVVRHIIRGLRGVLGQPVATPAGRKCGNAVRDGTLHATVLLQLPGACDSHENHHRK